MKKTRQITQKGFTLFETLVAIFILTLSITGPIYISSVAYRNTIESRDNIVAQYLAEEVIEVIRNKRDANMLDLEGTAGWLENITGSVNCFTSRCIMERDGMTNEYEFEACPPDANCANISFDTSGKIIYGNSDVSLTSKFIREFYFTKGKSDPATGEIPDREAALTVDIKWEDRGVEKVYTLTEHLYAIDYAKFFTQ